MLREYIIPIACFASASIELSLMVTKASSSFLEGVANVTVLPPIRSIPRAFDKLSFLTIRGAGAEDGHPLVILSFMLLTSMYSLIDCVAV